jgi:uncharacterized protein YcfJ
MSPLSNQQHLRKLVVLTTLASVTAASWAGPRVGSTVGTPSSATTTVQARVISSTPVVAQVATPREACYDEVRAEAPRSSGAGAIIGAIAGAAIGNAMGRGSGRAVATGVGLIGGAVLGDHIETDGRPGSNRTVRRCEQQTSYENQVVAYSVVYEVGGQRYTTQMPHEPGNTIPVQLTVSPTVAPAPQAVYMPPVVNSPVVYTSSAVLVADGPAYDRERERCEQRDERRHHQRWDRGWNRDRSDWR